MIRRNRIAQVQQHASVRDRLAAGQLFCHAFKKRGRLDVSRRGIPVVEERLGRLETVPSLVAELDLEDRQFSKLRIAGRLVLIYD